MVDVWDWGCDGIIGECKMGNIGFVVLCGGVVVGEYMVLFIFEDECIEFVYKVIDCFIFVKGVFRVVLWVKDKMFGFYLMVDVLVF